MDAERRSRAWMMIALVMLPLALGAGWWSGRSSARDSEPPPSPSAAPMPVPSNASTPAPDAAVRNPASAAAARPSNAPLPDLSTPLRNILPELKRRADAGDPAAACRLAAEMEFCDDVRRRLDEAANTLHYTGGGSGPAATPEFEARQRAAREAATARGEQALKESAHCEGIPAFDSRERLHYWRAAARGGSAQAINFYVMGRPFRREDTLEELDALRVYRDEVEAIALRGVAAGDITTTLALANAYSPHRRSERNLLNQAVTPDAGKSLALYLQAKALLDQPPPGVPRQGQLFDRFVRDLEGDLDATALARAREQAAAYRRVAPAPLLPSRARRANALPAGGPNALLREQCTP